MNYLLDTCVVSELWKTSADPHVLAWMAACDETSCYLSVLTIGEIRKGIERLPDSRKKTELQQWLTYDLRQRFAGRILGLTEQVAEIWGEVQGKAELQGRPMPVIDSLIAATGLAHKATIVTRNTDGMVSSGVQTLNPWEYPLPSA